MAFNVAATLFFDLFLLIPCASLIAVPIRFSIGDMNEMVLTEGTVELENWSQGRRNRYFKRRSEAWFSESYSCPEDVELCMASFVFCDSTKQKSSYARQSILNELLMSSTPPTKQGKVKIDEYPLFASDEKSCYIASMTPRIARRIAAQSCESDEKTCAINPLLPLYKLSYGTVERIQQTVEDRGTSITIMIEVSPHAVQKNWNITLRSFVDTILEQSVSQQTCRSQLRDTLPHTGKWTTCNDTLILDSSEVEADWMGDSYALFHITTSSYDSQMELTEKIFRFISSLAVRPEFSSISVSDYYNYII